LLSKLIGYLNPAGGEVLQREGRYYRFSRLIHSILHVRLPAILVQQRSHRAAILGLLHPVESILRNAHHAARLGDVLQLLSQIWQSHLVLDDALIYKTHARLLLVHSMIAW
jgi:hypothetical protein